MAFVCVHHSSKQSTIRACTAYQYGSAQTYRIAARVQLNAYAATVDYACTLLHVYATYVYVYGSVWERVLLSVIDSALA
eukprot:18023-Heterococcus_DN1.PRE.6